MTGGDIYDVAGKPAGNMCLVGGDGSSRRSATSTYIGSADGLAVDAQGDLYLGEGNVVQEVTANSGTQWGRSMTANDIYVVAGGGAGGTGVPATSADVAAGAVAIDSSGNLYIDNGTNVEEVARTSGSQWGQSMTADYIYRVAGVASGSGTSGDGGAATSADLEDSGDIALDTNGDLYIADGIEPDHGGGRIQEVPVATGKSVGPVDDGRRHVHHCR